MDPAPAVHAIVVRSQVDALGRSAWPWQAMQQLPALTGHSVPSQPRVDTHRQQCQISSHDEDCPSSYACDHDIRAVQQMLM